MDIKLDKNSSTEALIKITLKESDYQPKVEEKVKDYSKKANIKGFRPGKVPIGHIRKLYGTVIKVEEINKILSDSLREYIKENDLKIIGEPLPNKELNKDIEWDTQTDFEFEYNIGLVDEFEVNLKQKVKNYQIEPDDKTLNESIENLKKQYENAIEPEICEQGDNLNGELVQQETEYHEETWIFTDRLVKKELKKFTGLKVGDTAVFDPKKIYKEEDEAAHLLKKQKEELSEINGDFQFKISKITRVEPAELNQEFYNKVLGNDVVKSEKEFRDKLKETLADNYNREAMPYNNKLLRDKLIETTKMEIPEDFYKKWLITASNADINEEDLEKNFSDYIDDLKWTLITQKIEKDNNLKVENEEVITAAKNMIRSQFAAYGMTEELEKQLDSYAQNYLTSNNGENYMQIYNTVKTEKIIETIRNQMDISNKKVKPDEFSKIVSN